MDTTLILVCWAVGLTFARIPPAIAALRLHSDPERVKRVRALLNATAAIFSFTITILLLPVLLVRGRPTSETLTILNIPSREPLPRGYADYRPSDSTVSRTPGTAVAEDTIWADWIGDLWTFVAVGACFYLVSLGIALYVSGRSVAARLRPAGFGFRTGFGALFALTAVVALAIDGDYSLIFFIVLVASALVLVYQANDDYRGMIVPTAGPNKAEPENTEPSDDDPDDQTPPRPDD